MRALVVGADHLGRIPATLAAHGIEIMAHVSGRHASHQRKIASLPAEADMLVLLTDFLGHNVMRHYRELARADGIPFIACRRSVCSLVQALSERPAA